MIQSYAKTPDPRIVGIGMTSQRTRERLIRRLEAEGIKDPRVLDAIFTVPRHLFVDEALSHRAYEDTALPIGLGQTISQPYIVARMTEVLLAGKQVNSVLEVGTGCGYQTAVLSGMVQKVYSIERIKPLQERARERFRQLRLNNVFLRHGDGFEGWGAQAPFDAILVTAAPPSVPQTLFDQLRCGGRMVIPVGDDDSQVLLLITKDEQGRPQRQVLDPVRFVPMLQGIGN
ncbi:protein-L-isoaspartate(D-aspartate) O-methyltransferase [Spongorhabdus nitratireducens]